MRRALAFLGVLLFVPAAAAQPRPGPTTLSSGVAHGGLAARAGDIRLNRKVKAEMKQDAPPRSRAPALKGGNMRPQPTPRAATPPGHTPKPKPKPKPQPKPQPAPTRP